MGVLRLGGMGGMGDLWSRGMPAYQLREIPEDSFNAETISEMTRLAQEASVDPRLAVLAKRIVSGVRSKDYVSELRRIYDWVKQNVRYRQDARLVETLHHPIYMLQNPQDGFDCDDHAMLVAALCMALGHGAAFRTVCAERSAPNEPSHVYPLGLINQNGRVVAIPLDTTMQSKGFGWEPSAPQAWSPKTHVVVMP